MTIVEQNRNVVRAGSPEVAEPHDTLVWFRATVVHIGI
jgi:hypothetical protein